MSRRWDQVRLSVAVQHTPKRDGDPVYQRLLADLEPYPVDVVTSPQTGSTWPTYRLCLSRMPTTATHRLVLQDDVEAGRNLIAGVKKAIEERPDNLLSFFISRRPQQGAIAHLQACDRGEAWSRLDPREWIPAQALAWPAFMVGPMLRYGGEGPGADDELIGRFLRDRGLYALQSMPSLVEHVHHSTTTLPAINMPGPHRAAACWIGHAHDPAVDVDWRTGMR
jgi:hypothetical protein